MSGDTSTGFELAPGHLLAGRYRILRGLGQGGMGAVYEANQLALDRVVALKVMHPSLSAQRDLVARFEREARTLASLRHPNIVEVLDAGRDDTTLFLVMELLHGTPLDQHLAARTHWPLDAVLPLLAPVGKALGFLHAKGLVHRDMKPENVLLVREEDGTSRPKLLDFGLARPRLSGEKLTASGVILGTPAYMAPEQIFSDKDITPAADQWAFAASVYEAITGALPHAAETAQGLFVKRVSEAVVAPSKLVPELGAEVDRVLMKALAREPAARFDSMEALLSALDALKGATDAHATLLSPVTAPTMQAVSAEVLPAVEVPKEVAPVESQPDGTPTTRPRWPWVAGLAVVLTIAVGGWRLSRPTAVVAPLATPATRVTPAPERARLTLDFTPANAAITLDAQELGAGHASVELPRGSTHHLRVEAPGYLPFVETVRVDGDVLISRSLVARTVVAVPSPTTPTATPPTGHRPSAPAAPSIPHGRRPIDTQWPP